MTASEESFKDSQWALTERIKELECLYNFSSSIRRNEKINAGAEILKNCFTKGIRALKINNLKYRYIWNFLSM